MLKSLVSGPRTSYSYQIIMIYIATSIFLERSDHTAQPSALHAEHMYACSVSAVWSNHAHLRPVERVISWAALDLMISSVGDGVYQESHLWHGPTNLDFDSILHTTALLQFHTGHYSESLPCN